MQKKVLTEQALYYGDVAMPKGWDIDRDKLSGDILQSSFTNKEFPFSRNWDMLNTYMRDHIGLEYEINLVNKSTWGNIYKPAETTIPLLNIDPVDLRNSPDFTLLYGVKVKDCFVRIHFEDNRRKGRSWDIQLNNNQFALKPPKNVARLDGFETKEASLRKPGRTLIIAKEQWDHYQDLFDSDGNYIGQNKLKVNKKGGRSL